MILISYFTNTGTPAQSVSYRAPPSAPTQIEKTVRAGYDKTICFVCELSDIGGFGNSDGNKRPKFHLNQDKYSNSG